jgi:hypothetical protein
MGHPGDCMSPNSSTPGNSPTLKIPSQTSCRRRIGEHSPSGTALRYLFYSLITAPLIAPISVEFTPTNLKTGNFHLVHRKKQYGSNTHRWWHKAVLPAWKIKSGRDDRPHLTNGYSVRLMKTFANCRAILDTSRIFGTGNCSPTTWPSSTT